MMPIVAFARAGAEGGDQHGDRQEAGQRPGDRVVRDQQAGGGADEGKFGGAVHGEGDSPGADQWGDEPAGDRDQRRGEQGMLGEWLGGEEQDAHRRSWPPRGRPAGWCPARWTWAPAGR